MSNLDLNFNFFQGQTAYDLFFGVYENEHSGQLKNLDVSWNQLSVSFSWRTAQMLATVLRDNTTLTHLDLSYNKLNMQDMTVIDMKNNSGKQQLRLAQPALAKIMAPFLLANFLAILYFVFYV